MSDEQKDNVFSLTELIGAVSGKQYQTVDVYGGKVMIGSLSSRDFIAWLESNDDPTTRRTGGLRLIAKSIVDPVTKQHVPDDQHEATVASFEQKDARENGKLVAAALALNGLDRAAKTLETAKND